MPLIRPVQSFKVKDMPEAAAYKRSPTCESRFNYGFGAATADFPLAIF